VVKVGQNRAKPTYWTPKISSDHSGASAIKNSSSAVLYAEKV